MRAKINKKDNILSGSVLKAMVLYALPLIATNFLQLLFSAADVAVLGIFCENGDAAMAAVGTTTSLIYLIINLFVGLSVGTNVLVSRCVGNGDMEKSRRIVGCSVATSIICGTILLFIGFFGARTFLQWMNCDAEILGMAVKYLKIYFLGMPVIMLYNFSVAILRGVGDTFRPLMYLVVGGAVNVALNVLLVVAFQKDVEGVAVATVASQGISATFATIALFKETGAARLERKHIRIYKKEIIEMAQIGLPSGLQSCLFSISNVLVQSAINGFGEIAMAANTVAAQLDAFTYQAMYGISLTTTVFVGQNYGAKNIKRVKRSVYTALCLTTAVGIVVGCVLAVLARPLCSIMTDNAEVVAYARKRMLMIALPYFFCGLQETFAYALRGLGKSLTAMFVVLGGTCVFRVIWLNTVLKVWNTLTALYLLYPVSWLLTTLIFIPIYFIVQRKVFAELSREADLSSETEESMKKFADELDVSAT